MRGFAARLSAGIVGSVAEASAEFRVHRGRVLLSLIGVGVAVAALTGVVAAGGIAEQALREQSERYGGRPATMLVNAYQMDGSALDAGEVRDAFFSALERYGVQFAGERGYAQQDVRFPDGTRPVQVETVDVSYALMHRLRLASGTWFTDADERRMAPALVINERFWERIGSPDLRSHPTVTLAGRTEVTALVVGVTPSTSFDTEPTMFMLASQARALQGPGDAEMFGTPQFEMWVPPGVAEELGARFAADLRGQLDGAQVDAYRADYFEQSADSLRQVQLVVGGIAVLVLLLGALGLINIALVTVRTRIREIGIRRTFGATAGRIFFSVMMESVVATIVAGVLGVMLAVLIITNPITQDLIGQGVADLPPFPVDAAVTGLVASTVVGALAGLVPALVAVRVKVIDALRY